MKLVLSSVIIYLIVGLGNNIIAQSNDKINSNTTTNLGLYSILDSKEFRDSVVVPSTPLVVLGEIGLGSLLAIASAGLVGGVSSKLTSDDYTYAIILTYLAYSFGHSLGVYIVGKKHNKSTTFLELFGVSVLSAAVSAYAFYESDQRGIASLTPLFMPLLGPLIYTNLVYPPQSQNVRVEVLPSLEFRKNNLQYGVNLKISF